MRSVNSEKICVDYSNFNYKRFLENELVNEYFIKYLVYIQNRLGKKEVEVVVKYE